MAIIRSIPRKRRLASYRNVLMVDAVRGVLRVRKWPKKRGKATSERQKFWIDWFTQANLLAKYVDPMSMARAIEMTRFSGMYPRDILLKAMRGRLYFWSDETGWKWYSMAAIDDISESLDVLAQQIGSVLVRAVDRWRAPDAGAVGDVLIYQGPLAPPIWGPSGGGGGVTQQDLPSTPIIPDGTKSFYDIDVSGFANAEITMEGIGFAASDTLRIQLSTDGGATFKSGAADYWATYLSPTVMASATGNAFNLTYGSAGSGHDAVFRMTNLRASRAKIMGDCATLTSNTAHRSGRANFDGPITDIHIFAFNGNNFNAGVIRLSGLVA